MYIDVSTPAYIARYLRSQYGADPYDLSLPQNQAIKFSYIYWGIQVFEVPPPVEFTGTVAVIRMTWPIERRFQTSWLNYKDLEDFANRCETNFGKKNFFYFEFWTACINWVDGMIFMGASQIAGIRAFMQRHEINEDLISEESVVRILSRHRESNRKRSQRISQH